MDQISRIGMDTSKQIFQLHGVNTAEEPVLRKKLRRKEMFAFLEKLAPTVIAIEACGASHHCARLLQSTRSMPGSWLGIAPMNAADGLPRSPASAQAARCC